MHIWSPALLPGRVLSQSSAAELLEAGGAPTASGATPLHYCASDKARVLHGCAPCVALQVNMTVFAWEMWAGPCMAMLAVFIFEKFTLRAQSCCAKYQMCCGTAWDVCNSGREAALGNRKC